MNLWFGKAVFIAGFFAIGHIRDPHIKRNKTLKVVDDRKTFFDKALIVLVAVGGVLLPALWMIFDLFPFADRPLSPASLMVGVLLEGLGLWLFKRSHDDLGESWSVSLELKENHRLVNDGVYRFIRHPMYASLFLYSAAQAFLLPNGVIGPAGVVTFALLYFLRVRHEEKMMLEKFGDQYKAYMDVSKRIIPGVW